MWPIKTKQEIYREYMKEINKLRYEVEEKECDIEMLQRSIGVHNRRIEQLIETAELFNSRKEETE